MIERFPNEQSAIDFREGEPNHAKNTGILTLFRKTHAISHAFWLQNFEDALLPFCQHSAAVGQKSSGF